MTELSCQLKLVNFHLQIVIQSIIILLIQNYDVFYAYFYVYLKVLNLVKIIKITRDTCTLDCVI